MAWVNGINSMWFAQATKGENVYFISDGDYVKIGKTTGDPTARLASLQTGNPRELAVLGMAFNGRGGCATNLEHWLHELLKKHRVRGEWFSLEALEDLILYLKVHGKQTEKLFYSLDFEVCSFAGKPRFMFNEKWEEIVDMWDAREKTKSQLVDEYIEREYEYLAEVNKRIAEIKRLRGIA